MSVAPGDQASFSEFQRSGHTACYYKCISCGQRFWQKKTMVRRAAKCNGTRVSQNGDSQACKAWRCRYNDQCPGANTACAICGAFKPPEFMPTKPVTASSPAFVSRSASSADPSPDLANQPPANLSTGALISSLYGHPDSGSQWMIQVENASQSSGRNPPAMYVDDRVVSDQQNSPQMRGNITLLPLYGDVVERYLTDV
jgi:hypothetical protein